MNTKPHFRSEPIGTEVPPSRKRGAIRGIRSFSLLLLLLVPLWAAPAHGGQANNSQDANLSPAKISEYKAKLQQGREIEAEIGGRVKCLEAREGKLNLQSDHLEKEVGRLSRQEKALQVKVESTTAELKGFTGGSGNMEAQYGEAQRQLENLRKALRSCEQEHWFLRIFGKCSHYEHQIRIAEAQVEAAGRAYHDADVRRIAAVRKLRDVRGQLSGVKGEKSQNEQALTRVKAVLSQIQSAVHDNKGLLNGFAYWLREADRVDTTDTRARTALKIADFSSKVDELIKRSPEVVKRADSVLPAGCSQAPQAPHSLRGQVTGVLRPIHSEFKDHDRTVAHLARRLRTSPLRLRRLFAAELRATPKSYIREVRLRTLPGNSVLSVKEVMAAVGFNNPSHARRSRTKILREAT